jgi:hypothetical protein
MNKMLIGNICRNLRLFLSHVEEYSAILRTFFVPTCVKKYNFPRIARQILNL